MLHKIVFEEFPELVVITLNIMGDDEDSKLGKLSN